MATRTTNHNKSARTGSGNRSKRTTTAMVEPLVADAIDVIMVDYSDTKATMTRQLAGKPITSKMAGWVIIDGHKHYGYCDQLTDGSDQWYFHTLLDVPLVADNQNIEPVPSGDPANDDDDTTDEGDAETKNGG